MGTGFNELVLNSISEGLITVDHDLKIMNANKTFIDAHGRSKDDIIGRHCYEISHNSAEPCSSEEHLCPIRKVMETGEKSTTTHTHFDKDGNVIYVQLSAYPIRDDNGNMIQFIEISKDITDQIKAQEQLEETVAELEEAYEELSSLDELKSHILSNVSHELKTPIAIVLSSLELLRTKEDENDEKTMLFDMAFNALLRQNKIVNDLIMVSKIDRLKNYMNIEKVNVRILLKICAGEFKSAILDSKLKLVMDVHNSTILADYAKLKSVFDNLIQNAIKFSKKGGTINIYSEEREDYFIIAIKDTGIGIDAVNIAKVFDRLYQVDSTMTRKYGGTGVGLAIVKEIINGHKWDLKIESTLGEGTIFRILIPNSEVLAQVVNLEV